MTDSVRIDTLPPGASIAWTDGSDHKHVGVVVDWPDRPTNAEGVKVIETIVSEVMHVIDVKRRVEVVA